MDQTQTKTEPKLSLAELAYQKGYKKFQIKTHEDKEIWLIEMSLCQMWLMDNHNMYVMVELDQTNPLYPKFCYDIHQLEMNADPALAGEFVRKVDILQWGLYRSYSEALEAGLIEALFHITSTDEQLKIKYNKIYDILVNLGGANEIERTSFIYGHISNPPLSEWRFQGKFGFGGKYWSTTNAISYYPEDKTKERESLMKSINKGLKKL